MCAYACIILWFAAHLFLACVICSDLLTKSGEKIVAFKTRNTLLSWGSRCILSEYQLEYLQTGQHTCISSVRFLIVASSDVGAFCHGDLSPCDFCR